MYKVGIVGHFGLGETPMDGQTVKTNSVANELISYYGADQIKRVDTFQWKKNSLTLLYRCVTIAFSCKNIIIISGYSGVRFFIPFFTLISKPARKKLHYVVIGGWLPSLLERNKGLRNRAKKLDCIYVETTSMIEAMNRLGVRNAVHLPNFKRLKAPDEAQLLNMAFEKPFRLCTFSRVSREKGIEDAIDAVTRINDEKEYVAYALDIYGQVDREYVARFNELRRTFPDYINYRGIIAYGNSVEVIRKYFVLLFPTYYKGEGFPGTIIDAFSSGVPVVATKWKYNEEIVRSGVDGILYDRENDGLIKVLTGLLETPIAIIREMKRQCIRRSSEFLPEKVMATLIDNIV